MAWFPTEDLLPTAEVDPERVKKYAKMPAKTAPPVEYVERDGQKFIVDGNGRWFAAELRGDGQIEAEPSPLDKGILARWLAKFIK